MIEWIENAILLIVLGITFDIKWAEQLGWAILSPFALLILLIIGYTIRMIYLWWSRKRCKN